MNGSTPLFSQFKLGLLEGIEAKLMNRPTDWRASGITGPSDDRFWLPPVEALTEFNAGITAGFALVEGASHA